MIICGWRTCKRLNASNCRVNDEARFQVQVRAPEGTSLDQTRLTAERLQGTWIGVPAKRPVGRAHLLHDFLERVPLRPQVDELRHGRSLATYLVAAGVGTVGIVDDEWVELSTPKS